MLLCLLLRKDYTYESPKSKRSENISSSKECGLFIPGFTSTKSTGISKLVNGVNIFQIKCFLRLISARIVKMKIDRVENINRSLIIKIFTSE